MLTGTLARNPLYEQWQNKAKDFSFVQIHGHSELDPDRARFAVNAMLSIPGMPKNLKRALKDFENWTVDRIAKSLLSENGSKFQM